MKSLLNNLTIEDIKRLISPYYTGHHISAVHNESIFVDIIASKDLSLVKKYMVYVDNINMYLSEAVATGNIEIVKLFLDKGANINYLTDEVILGRLTPLKTAIVNNNYEMAKYLIDNGADVNLQVNSDDFLDRLNNYQIDIFNSNNRIETVNEDDKEAKQLKYIRTSSPLEYAIKINEIYHREDNTCNYTIHFNGESCKIENKLLGNTLKIYEHVKNRGKIVDLIFDKLEDKTNINLNDLICFTFITRDLEQFKKYSKFALNNNYQIDFDFIFKLYFDFELQYDKAMSIPFIDLIEKYDKGSNILKLFDYYLNREIFQKWGRIRFYVNDFNKELLNRISAEKRKERVLVPYCKDIDSLKYLISLGFDINQADEKGRNILYHLLCDKTTEHLMEDLTGDEIKLFNYLLEKVNLSMKDNDNKTVLYYAMQKFYTGNDYISIKDWVRTRSNLEKAVTVLISRMPKQDVCNDDIKKILEGRLEYQSDFGEGIAAECVYQHHKELFESLIDKGFVLSDRMLKKIFDSLYPEKESEKERLLEYVDMDNTLDFLYKKLDYNIQIQELDIESEFKKIMLNLDSQDITFDEFIKDIKNFNNQINCLNQFYENNIEKRFDPEKYVQYAYEKYNTSYANLDDYLEFIIIKGIMKFGSEKLIEILNSIPNYDINNYIVNADIGFGYWSYEEQITDIIGFDEEGEPLYGEEHFEAEGIYTNDNEYIVFNGSLIQYAILTDNLPMVQLLQKRGANLKFLLYGEDYTYDYVCSHTMLNYIESFVGKKEYRDFSANEREYYLGLINSNIESKNEQPIKLVLKNDSER